MGHFGDSGTILARLELLLDFSIYNMVYSMRLGNDSDVIQPHPETESSRELNLLKNDSFVSGWRIVIIPQIVYS